MWNQFCGEDSTHGVEKNCADERRFTTYEDLAKHRRFAITRATLKSLLGHDQNIAACPSRIACCHRRAVCSLSTVSIFSTSKKWWRFIGHGKGHLVRTYHNAKLCGQATWSQRYALPEINLTPRRKSCHWEKACTKGDMIWTTTCRASIHSIALLTVIRRGKRTWGTTKRDSYGSHLAAIIFSSQGTLSVKFANVSSSSQQKKVCNIYQRLAVGMEKR